MSENHIEHPTPKKYVQIAIVLGIRRNTKLPLSFKLNKFEKRIYSNITNNQDGAQLIKLSLKIQFKMLNSIKCDKIN